MTRLGMSVVLKVKYSGISIKWTPLVQKMCPLYRDVHFMEIFSEVVWKQKVCPQSKAIRSSSYYQYYGGVRFIEIPLYFGITTNKPDLH